MLYAEKIRAPLMWFFSLGVALVSLRFLILGLEGAFAGVPEMMEHLEARNLAFILHVSASPVALILGLFQFLPRLRAKNPALHRWSGRLYVALVLIGGSAGLVLVLGMFDRPGAAFGFGLLAILWVGVTAQAIRLAMAGRIAEHRRWMIRSYALTFAAVTLRLELPFFIALGGMDYAEASSYVAWMCWVPNLAFAELYLRRRHGSAESKMAIEPTGR